MELQQAVEKVNPFEGWHFRVYGHHDERYTWGFYIGSRRKSSPSPVCATVEECEDAIKRVNIIGATVFYFSPGA